ncbi:MAG: hypothetical protein RBR58_00240 [Candidatus Humimicrobiaceae bacterium]|nr:hypothetical protein [Candidatus Humimicrobiaceae bacterium]
MWPYEKNKIKIVEVIIAAFSISLFNINHRINIISDVDINIIAEGRKVSENFNCPML